MRQSNGGGMLLSLSPRSSSPRAGGAEPSWFQRHKTLVTLSMIILSIALIAIYVWVLVYTIVDAIHTNRNTDDINILKKSGGGGGGSGNTTNPMKAAVLVPFTSVVLNSGLYYVELGTPEDLVGNFSSFVTVTSSSPAGDEVISSRDVFEVVTDVNTQYSNQGGGGSVRRTFHIIQYNGLGVGGGASGIPRPSNNWRISVNYDTFGLNAGEALRVVLNTNAQGPLTLNSGSFTLVYL